MRLVSTRSPLERMLNSKRSVFDACDHATSVLTPSSDMCLSFFVDDFSVLAHDRNTDQSHCKVRVCETFRFNTVPFESRTTSTQGYVFCSAMRST